MSSVHKAVLLHEVLEVFGLSDRSDAPIRYLDGTLGGAGHALAVARALDGNLSIIGLDMDPRAIQRAKEELAGKSKDLILENENFRNLDEVLDRHGIKEVDLILLDLGLSSDELENSGKGFSFMKDEPLLMIMGDRDKYPFTARDIVNDWKEESIADVIFGYGEERYARRIARKIVEYREKKSIETSGELAEIVKTSVPFFYRRAKIHPATKTFQALRIAVNDELGALKEGLERAFERLSEGGILAVISFHSLEDRIVKHFYKEKVESSSHHDDMNKGPQKSFEILTKRPITASLEEISMNPRSRSAKLRAIKKIHK